jgi:hypothetical protein
MFRFTTQAPRALAATAAFVLLTATAAQAQTTAPNGQPLPTRARRNATRQSRIARNIQEEYSHKWEVAGGGGFLRFRTGPTLQRITEVNFFLAPSYHFNPRWAVVGDVRGLYGNANIPNEFALNGVYSPQISEYTFMGGPQYRFVRREKYSLSASATVGLALSKFGGDAKGLPSQDLGMWPDSNAKPAFSVNLIADYNIFTNFAVRVQPTYLGTTFGSTVQNNLGIQFGVVYRFGRQK